MRQTTLTQYFNPPIPPGKTAGYRTITIDGTNYLLDDTMNHLMVVPTLPVAPSSTAQGITLIDLSESFVMPSAKKQKQKRKFKREPILLS
jgi:hypothetical protein